MRAAQSDEKQNSGLRVNGCPLYDRNAPPKHFKRIGVVTIGDWCIAVAGEPLLASTGAIGRIDVKELPAFNAAKSTLQFVVDVPEPDEPVAATSASSASASASATTSNKPKPPMSTNVQTFAQQLVDIALPLAPGDAARDAARQKALREFENELYLFKNAAYAAGLVATRQ